MDEEVKFEVDQDEVDEFNNDDNYANDNDTDFTKDECLEENEPADGDGEPVQNHHQQNGNGTAAEADEESASAAGDGESNQQEQIPSTNNIKTEGGSQKSKDEDKRKLFVGGLSWNTKQEDLKEYFSKFGEVEGLTYKTDALTGRPRGFAFIIFTDLSAVEAVLAAGEHVINGKKVDPKRAKARPGKVFVGGLIPEITNDDVRNYFSQYGTVLDMEVPIDKATGQRKSYCFVTFEDVHIANELLKTPKQTICGREVDVKQAQPQQRTNWGAAQGAGAMGRGGAVGGRGGGMRGRGRGAAWGGGFGGYGPAYGPPDYSGYSDYYGGYGGFGGDYYGGGYGYEGYYDNYPGPPMSGCPALSRGGRGFIGKARGGTRGTARHTPY